jgi:hypothetical protein
MPLLGFSNGGKKKKKKKNMQNSGLWLSDTVCTAPFGTIFSYYNFVYLWGILKG